MGVCFEVAYDDILRTGVKQGGQAIIIPTNNASFLDSGEAAQQLAQGRVQAVVHGRSVIQASTVGYTAIIDPRSLGHIHGRASWPTSRCAVPRPSPTGSAPGPASSSLPALSY